MIPGEKLIVFTSAVRFDWAMASRREKSPSLKSESSSSMAVLTTSSPAGGASRVMNAVRVADNPPTESEAENVNESDPVVPESGGIHV